MPWSLDDMLQDVPAQRGNGGRVRVPNGVFKDLPEAPRTQIDKTAVAVKEILETDAKERAEKTARLKAARLARDGGSASD